jgi:SAM-dependent methyltransferase
LSCATPPALRARRLKTAACSSWNSPALSDDAGVAEMDMGDDRRYLQMAAEHFSLRFNESGESARGVDWDCGAGEELRFAQLCRVIDATVPYSINDIGCGYGALVEFLARAGDEFSYHGLDVASLMIEAARLRHEGKPNRRFSCSAQLDMPADYTVASGIFHMRFGRSAEEMAEYQLRTLDMMERMSTRGFSFNCFSSCYAADRQRHHLYYSDPRQLLDHCMQRYSAQVALLHDYDPLEFTIVVRKPQPPRAAEGS